MMKNQNVQQHLGIINRIKSLSKSKLLLLSGLSAKNCHGNESRLLPVIEAVSEEESNKQRSHNNNRSNRSEFSPDKINEFSERLNHSDDAESLDELSFDEGEHPGSESEVEWKINSLFHINDVIVYKKH